MSEIIRLRNQRLLAKTAVAGGVKTFEGGMLAAWRVPLVDATNCESRTIVWSGESCL
jgi:hypothetical protein